MTALLHITATVDSIATRKILQLPVQLLLAIPRFKVTDSG
ncbi:MAG: hypothetical protein OFPII_17780 [Osedax symbiont Rs1]|nr:MAG: hypothetical protein OFPII_17780 [Osedax symbiont Rs1]